MNSTKLSHDKPGLSQGLSGHSSPHLSQPKPLRNATSSLNMTSQSTPLCSDSELGKHNVRDTPNTYTRIRKTRLVVTTPSEKQVEQALTRAVQKRGGLCWKLVSPGTAGVPDRLILLPGGHVGFAEVKAPGGKIRAIQKHRIRGLRQLGMSAHIINNPARIEEVLNEISAA